MNLARVEHYFAEVLSRIEDQTIEGDRWRCKPLMTTPITVPEDLGAESPVGSVGWHAGRGSLFPPNLAVVGTVNMDESTHGFSRKVLDRAFTLELSDVELSRWGRLTEAERRYAERNRDLVGMARLCDDPQPDDAGHRGRFFPVRTRAPSNG